MASEGLVDHHGHERAGRAGHGLDDVPPSHEALADVRLDVTIKDGKAILRPVVTMKK